jgi:hypothetical protein
MKIGPIAAAATLVALTSSLVSPASADVLTITYAGSFVSGADVAGVFGTPGTNLLGDTYRLVDTFDTADGVLFDNGISTSLTGIGAGSAVLTIAGLGTLSVGGNSSVLDGNNVASLTNQVVVDLFPTGDPGVVLQNTISAFAGGTSIPESIFTPFSLDAAQLAAGGSAVSFEFDVVDENYPPSATATIWGDANVTAFSVTNSDVSGVPEPATWAMMLIGFGMVGMRLKRSARAAPSA